MRTTFIAVAVIMCLRCVLAKLLFAGTTQLESSNSLRDSTFNTGASRILSLKLRSLLPHHHERSHCKQDDHRSFASATAIKDGSFIAVGSEKEVMAYRGDNTRVRVPLCVEIKQLESVLTIVGGNVVYGTGDFESLAPPRYPLARIGRQLLSIVDMPVR